MATTKKNTTSKAKAVKGAKNALIKESGKVTVLESRKAVRDSETKEYTTKAQYSVKATFKPATVKTVECVVFSSNGCYAVATRSGSGKITLTAKPVNSKGMEVEDAEFKASKNKACYLTLKKYLERKLKLDTMNWSTLIGTYAPKAEETKA